MKPTFFFISVVTLIGMLAGCSGPPRFHKSQMPEPASFNAHFGDMDASGDDRVDWAEFDNHFDQATLEVFQALDVNRDGGIDHDEWHKFKEAHGIKDH